MKRFICLLAFLVVALPAWPEKTITVAQLDDMVNSMEAAKKSDAEIASALKQVKLSEQMPFVALSRLLTSAPGPLAKEQIYVLEARSAILPPPAADIPADPAPDRAAQKSILDRAAAYVAKYYDRLPALTGTKTVLRFQDNVEATVASSGQSGGAMEVTVGSAAPQSVDLIHYINSTETAYRSDRGIETFNVDKNRWGANGMIAIQAPEPSLGEAFQDAQTAGTIGWLRWEILNGRRVAVFSFGVAKKDSHFISKVCCFPSVTDAGMILHNDGGASMATVLGTSSVSPGGNFQTVTDWQKFEDSDVPYHGEFFIDADTGIVLRLITQGEFRPTGVVHQQDTRVDYAPAKVGDHTAILPARTIVLSEVAAHGDSQAAGRYITRKTFFTIAYKNYQGKLDSTFLDSLLAPAVPTAADTRRQEALVNKIDSEKLNSLLTQARKADAEQRYSDAEALMLPLTQAKPNLVLPWIELGIAQLALRKYPDAENAFKAALTIDPVAIVQQEHASDFYQTQPSADGVGSYATKSSSLGGGGTVLKKGYLPPEIKGTCYAGLGEVYAHEGKVKEAQEAFDLAAQAYPSLAAKFRHNEMVAFFQTGKADEQEAAAEQAIALDPSRAANYYFKAQALAMKAVIDPKTQKMILPPGCLDAYKKYLALDPKGPYSADARGIVNAAN